MRGTSWLVVGYGGAQALRLASNLILARLLFPEAFGLMALVTMVTVGLMLFSDVGISPAIAQSPRGDDPDFLNTAWTLQVIRGVILWILATALAAPLAAFYAAPDLALYLPIAALALLISGFNPTRIETANRHLALGRLTQLDLAAQAIGVAAMIGLAWMTGSVLALVIGGVVTAAAKLILTHLGLPGPRNRFRLERAALASLLRFGGWIFLSTAFFFVSSQGDRAILGKFLSLDALGLYNIGYFLASFPLLLIQAVTLRLLIPVYRDLPPTASAQNRAKLSRLRHAMTAAGLSMIAVMALAGPWLVDLLYDARYAAAGGIVTALACALAPQIVGASYDQAALAAGDSRRFFLFSASRASLQVVFLFAGFAAFGLAGALGGLGLALLASHLVLIRLARLHGAWDARHDAVWLPVTALLVAAALWLNHDAVLALADFGLRQARP
ncbi:MAG: polysaccharide biosynthesis protein [Rhodobacteraceae bacterium]|nr:MAG: polysaccharide biosynthesis protein [Paracoccaceae bacterium]